MTQPSTARATVIRATGEGPKRWFYGGGVHTWKVTAEEAGGEFLLFEDHLVQGKATPLHCHPDADETMYMLEGEILLHIDGVEHPLGPGGTVMAPKGVPHAFLVTSPVARMLCLHTPGGAQAFFWGASEATDQAEPTGPVDFERVRAAAEATGATQLLGPPPFAQ